MKREGEGEKREEKPGVQETEGGGEGDLEESWTGKGRERVGTMEGWKRRKSVKREESGSRKETKF